MALNIESPLAEFSEVEPKLYITGAAGITKWNINSHQIKCIINATKDIPYREFAGVERMRISLSDNDEEDIKQYFDLFAAKVVSENERNRSVVVHCQAGCSRSATLVIAYLIKSRGMDLKEAHKLLREKRKIIRPNPGFFKQLIEYEKHIRKSNTVQMVTIYGLDGYTLDIPDVYIED
ncbi:Dual specificity phosphatase [Leptotrombidium deliense]|uniref:Dual specificity phosphatase n=1 Tax=Leptotrombidium deliense TaxID=299467 RepID=A0A443SHS4_9ACAR|nr:Dual specificity phosphatase [Leptotrombidium deliense]